MSDMYLAQLNREGVATTAGMRLFDSGSEAIEIIFELAEELPTGEKSIPGLLWMTDKSLDRTTKTLAAVGVDVGDPALATDDELCTAIEGKQFKLVCALEAANKYHKTDKWIVRYINGPKREPVAGSSSALAKLRGTKAPDRNDDDNVPF